MAKVKIDNTLVNNLSSAVNSASRYSISNVLSQALDRHNIHASPDGNGLYNQLNNISSKTKIKITVPSVTRTTKMTLDYFNRVTQVTNDLNHKPSCEGCINMCLGGCSNKCLQQCASGCNTSCSRGCQSGCKKDCDWRSDHASFCFGSCDSWCYGCGSTCYNACNSSCGNNCSGACHGDCDWTCVDACYDTCTHGCAKSCSGSGEARIYGTWYLGCSGSCSRTCGGSANRYSPNVDGVH